MCVIMRKTKISRKIVNRTKEINVKKYDFNIFGKGLMMEDMYCNMLHYQPIQLEMPGKFNL